MLSVCVCACVCVGPWHGLSDRQHIEVVTKVYELALAESLSDGYMGTEENIFAMAYARFPELFAGYDNNQWGDHGDNCAIFNHQSRIRKAKQAALAAAAAGKAQS